LKVESLKESSVESCVSGASGYLWFCGPMLVADDDTSAHAEPAGLKGEIAEECVFPYTIIG
jgi:hypothetical protein